MLAVGGIGTATITPRGAHRGPDTVSEPDVCVPEARALIPIAAPAPSDRLVAPTRRPLAAFLAHLIATQTQAPQTRTRRRAEPEEVLASYGVASVRPAKAGRKLARDA